MDRQNNAKLKARIYPDDPRLTEVEVRLIELAGNHYGDLELLKRTEEGDRRALGTLALKGFEDYGAILCHWLYRKTARGELAVVFLQEALRCVARSEAADDVQLQEPRHELLEVAGSIEELERWIQLAGFDLSGLPDEFDVWRGMNGSSLEEIHASHHWIRDRELAVHLGCRQPHKGACLLARRRVRCQEVSMWIHRDEPYLVVLRPGPCEVDGTPEEWIHIIQWFGA